jgi:hypothetical protein
MSAPAESTDFISQNPKYNPLSSEIVLLSTGSVRWQIQEYQEIFVSLSSISRERHKMLIIVTHV